VDYRSFTDGAPAYITKRFDEGKVIYGSGAMNRLARVAKSGQLALPLL